MIYPNRNIYTVISNKLQCGIKLENNCHQIVLRRRGYCMCEQKSWMHRGFHWLSTDTASTDITCEWVLWRCVFVGILLKFLISTHTARQRTTLASIHWQRVSWFSLGESVVSSFPAATHSPVNTQSRETVGPNYQTKFNYGWIITVTLLVGCVVYEW